MPLSSAAAVKQLLVTSNLHLAATDADVRHLRSAEHAAACIRLLHGASLTLIDKNGLTMFITGGLAPTGLWQPKDLSELVQAIGLCVHKKKRSSQNFLDNMTDYFLEDEWQRWKSAVMQESGGTAIELIQRMKSIGAKNLDEYSKKRLVAIWLFLRGDGRTAGVAARAVAAEQFKQRLEGALRLHGTEEYIPELPPVAV